MSVKSSVDIICKSLPAESTIMSNLAFLETIITNKPVQPETIQIEYHEDYNQKKLKELAIRFQQEWFY